MLWVTRPRPHVDGAACAWLIRRFVDPEATFGFADDLDTVLMLGGTPFAMPAVELGARDGACAFERTIAKYDLGEPALEELAALVHDAELDDGLYPTAEAPGVDAVVRGLRATADDDNDFLVAVAPVFEGLYAWFLQQED